MNLDNCDNIFLSPRRIRIMLKTLFSFLYVCFFAMAATVVVTIGGSLLMMHWLSIIIMKIGGYTQNKREFA